MQVAGTGIKVNFFPTPARGNANGISEIIKQKEKGAVIVPGAYAPGTLRPHFLNLSILEIFLRK